MKRVWLAAAATAFGVCAWAGDQDHTIGDNCGSPPGVPAVIDGETATSGEMDAARVRVDGFLKESDRYQMCLMRFWARWKEHATWGRTTVPRWIEVSIKERIQANQRDKEAIGGAFNRATRAYKAKHPG